MNRDDVIRMTRESGISDTYFDFQMVSPEDLERFAALVAAAEREACAQLVQKNADVCGPNTMLCDVLRGNAAAIRARGES